MPLLLVAWTFAIWTLRIRNVLAADDGAGALVVPIGLTVLAIAAVVDRRRGTLALAAATALVWLVRVPLVLSNDHGAAFTIVHVMLALVSWFLAALAVRSVRRSGTHRDGRRPEGIATAS